MRSPRWNDNGPGPTSGIGGDSHLTKHVHEARKLPPQGLILCCCCMCAASMHLDLLNCPCPSDNRMQDVSDARISTPAMSRVPSGSGNPIQFWRRSPAQAIPDGAGTLTRGMSAGAEGANAPPMPPSNSAPSDAKDVETTDSTKKSSPLIRIVSDSSVPTNAEAFDVPRKITPSKMASLSSTIGDKLMRTPQPKSTLGLNASLAVPSSTPSVALSPYLLTPTAPPPPPPPPAAFVTEKAVAGSSAGANADASLVPLRGVPSMSLSAGPTPVSALLRGGSVGAGGGDGAEAVVTATTKSEQTTPAVRRKGMGWGQGACAACGRVCLLTAWSARAAFPA